MRMRIKALRMPEELLQEIEGLQVLMAEARGLAACPPSRDAVHREALARGIAVLRQESQSAIDRSKE